MSKSLRIEKSQSTVSMVPKKMSLQLSLKKSVGDIWITQLDW